MRVSVLGHACSVDEDAEWHQSDGYRAQKKIKKPKKAQKRVHPVSLALAHCKYREQDTNWKAKVGGRTWYSISGILGLGWLRLHWLPMQKTWVHTGAMGQGNK